MTEQIRNPKLRFRDNKGNDYSPWNLYSIKDVAKMSSGKSKKNENKGRYIIMDMGTVTKNGTMLTHKITPHENDLLKKGDLVMVKDDIGGGHIIGKTIFIPESQKYVLGDHVYRLEPKNYDGLFLHYCINSPIVNRSLKRKVTGSAQLGLNRKSVEEELIKVPCLEEQEKIGGFFSKLDRQIELEEQKLSLLEEQKKEYMQKIFSQELSFKDKHGNSYPNWKELNFFDVLDKIIDFRGRTPKKLNMDWSNAGYLALSAVNVKKGYIDYNVEAKYGGKELYKKWMKGNELQKGQVLFTTEAPMGNVAQVPDNKGYILSQRTIAFNTNEKITNDFLASLLSSKKVYNKLLRLSSGATAKGVSQKTLKSLYVTIPISIEEQQKIGEFLKKIDNLINKQFNKVYLLKERKKGFLQKMFV